MQSFTSLNSKSIGWLVQQHCQINCFSLQCVITQVISGKLADHLPGTIIWTSVLSWQHDVWIAGQWHNQFACHRHLLQTTTLFKWGHLTSRSALCLYSSEGDRSSSRGKWAWACLLPMWKKLLMERIDMSRQGSQKGIQSFISKKEQCSVETKIKFN